MAMIDTRHVRGRRRLRFADFNDVLGEVRALAERPTRPLGNWTLGQVCQHLATAIEVSISGGADIRVPLRARLLARLVRRRILKNGLPTGVRLPGEGAARLMPGPTSNADGVAALERAIEHLRSTRTRHPHPALGRMNVRQWNAFHLRHAELHLSFILPEELAPGPR